MKNKLIDLNCLSEFKQKIINLIILNFRTSTTSLAVTEEGVSVLDGTVGKILNDKFGGCTFEQVGQDFYVTGADAVRKKLCDATTIPDMNITITCYYSVHLHNSSYAKNDIDVPLSRSTYTISVRDGKATFSGGYASGGKTGYAAVGGSSNTITLSNATNVTVSITLV